MGIQILALICLFFSVSRLALLSGAGLQCWYLASRGLKLGRLPLLGPHDTLMLFSCCLAVATLISSFSPALKDHRGYRWTAGICAAMAGLTALRFPPVNVPLPQILDTMWFELHVILAFLGYALFLAGAILAIFYLFDGKRSAVDICYKLNLTGWVFFSASMVAGGIWGYYAWGTYWLWTPKEFWTSILWLFYALVLHLRIKGARADRFAAWMSVLGASIMLFTYLGVSLLMKSSHSF